MLRCVKILACKLCGIEALVGEIGRAASRIKGDLDAVGADLGIDTT